MKTNAREELARAEKLLEKIEAHPLTAKIRADEAALTLATRTAAAERIKALRDEQEAILPRLRKNLADAEDELRAYDAGRKPIEEKVRLAKFILMDESARLDREINMTEGELLSNYDERIDEAITFFQNKREALLLEKPHIFKRTGDKNLVLWKEEIITFSNVGAIRAALAYTLAALRELEQMKRAPAADLARIEQLKEGIPVITEVQQWTGSKPLTEPIANPLYALAAGVESTLAATLEKVDALLAKKKRTYPTGLERRTR